MIFNMVYSGNTPTPEPTWDYTVVGHTFTESTLDDIDTEINPFSTDNINRDWEMIINANTTYSTEGLSTIGVLYYTGSESTRYCLEVGIRPEGLYLYIRGNLNGISNKVFTCNPIDKDVRIAKVGTTILIYCDGTLITAYGMTTTIATTANKIILGRWYGGSGTYHFSGYMNYFKFRFTS